MISPGLKKATAVSFLLHMAFIILMVVNIRRTPSFQMPSPYVVKLIAPSAPKSARIPSKKKLVQVVDGAEEEKGVRLTPEPKIKKKARAPKPEDNRKKLEAHKEKSLEAIKARKEAAEYREGKLSKMESIRKLKQLKALGAEKARVKVVRKPEAADAAPGDATTSTSDVLLGEYLDRVGAEIYNEWVFPGFSDNNIEIVVGLRILKNGNIIITGIEKESGNAVFDAQVLKAINRASPVEPPRSELEVGYRFCLNVNCE